MKLIAQLLSAVLGSPLWPASGLFTLMTNVISLSAVVVVTAGVIGLIWWWTSSNPYRRHR